LRDHCYATPTALRDGPYRFFIYAGDGGEPPHVHVRRDGFEAKFWLEPVQVAASLGFPDQELNRIRRLVVEHAGTLMEAWHDYLAS
jgi:hypothetical protein